MDMRLGIEPLHVIEKRHILKAIERCNGNVRYAAELLEIGRTTIYRKLLEWGVCPSAEWMPVMRDYPQLVGANMKPYKRRRYIESVIESHGGNLTEAAAAINYKKHRLAYSMSVWHRDNEAIINEKARDEGISADEIEKARLNKEIERLNNILKATNENLSEVERKSSEKIRQLELKIQDLEGHIEKLKKEKL